MLLQPSTPREASHGPGQRRPGADVIKLFTGSNVTRTRVLPMRDVAAAAVAEAHARGKLVFAHPANASGLDVALEAWTSWHTWSKAHLASRPLTWRE